MRRVLREMRGEWLVSGAASTGGHQPGTWGARFKSNDSKCGRARP